MLNLKNRFINRSNKMFCVPVVDKLRSSIRLSLCAIYINLRNRGGKRFAFFCSSFDLLFLFCLCSSHAASMHVETITKVMIKVVVALCDLH